MHQTWGILLVIAQGRAKACIGQGLQDGAFFPLYFYYHYLVAVLFCLIQIYFIFSLFF